MAASKRTWLLDSTGAPDPTDSAAHEEANAPSRDQVHQPGRRVVAFDHQNTGATEFVNRILTYAARINKNDLHSFIVLNILHSNSPLKYPK
jgi:hypothetical protein